MIYTISEYMATAIDSIVLICFLAYTLSFKKPKQKLNIVTSIAFMLLFFSCVTIFNNITIAEGIYAAFYFLIFFMYCRISLKGKWWQQLLLVTIELAVLFLVNAVITIISASVLKSDYSSVLLMRNPVRVFLLFLSKISLIGLLFPIINGIRKQKIVLYLLQASVFIIFMILTVIIGIIIEKIILDNLIPMQYVFVIMGCISVIAVLLLFILIQFSIQNQNKLKQIVLQTRLHDNEVKMQEAVQWNQSMKALQHDLNNHIAVIASYIEKGNSDKALTYMKKISGKLEECPNYTDTNSQILNAILDLKRVVCKNKNISLKCYIQNDLPKFDDVTFSTIFGNLMDNAIEAEREEDQKEIRLAIESLGTYLHITIQNRIQNPVLINGSLPKTTKSDKTNHGLGIYSIHEAIAQSNGVIHFYEKEGWFLADVLIPV